MQRVGSLKYKCECCDNLEDITYCSSSSMQNGDLHLGRNVWNRNVYSISKFAWKDAEEGLKVSGYIHIYKYNLGKSFVTYLH